MKSSPPGDLEELIAGSPRFELGGPGVSAEVMAAAEARLGKPFARSYRWFLARYGAGMLLGYELNGLAPPAYEPGADALDFFGDIVSQHLRNMGDERWNGDLVEIVSFEGEDLFCFDTSGGLSRAEYPIVEVDITGSVGDVFADDFYEFLRRLSGA